MKRLHGRCIIVLAAVCLISTGGARAQHTIRQSVFGSGGCAATGMDCRLLGTVGQPAIGSTQGALYNQETGFWCQCIGTVTHVAPLSEIIPDVFRLEQNFPNPFNPVTTIVFAVPRAVHVTLVLYDMLGRQVAVLVDEAVDPGDFRVLFDASGLSSGVYFYRITAGPFSQIKKLTLLK